MFSHPLSLKFPFYPNSNKVWTYGKPIFKFDILSDIPGTEFGFEAPRDVLNIMMLISQGFTVSIQYFICVISFI